MKTDLQEMKARLELPEIVKEYEDDMYPGFSMTDGTQSYYSKMLISKNGKENVIVSIERGNVEIEFLLPGGIIIYRNGDHPNIDRLYKQICISEKIYIKEARMKGICREGRR